MTDQELDRKRRCEQMRQLRQIERAAEDLLHALRLCMEMEDGPNGHPCYCDEPHFEGGKCHICTALAAISKAEGRE